MVHDILQHVYHLVGCGLADDLVGLRRESGKDIAVVVLDACDKEGINTYAFVWECSICIDHLPDTDLAWSQAKTDDRVELAFDTERTHHTHELLGREERHEVGGDPVAGLLQSPIEGDHFALVGMVVISWRPCYTIAID